jgi:hypothetical protein
MKINKRHFWLACLVFLLISASPVQAKKKLFGSVTVSKSTAGVVVRPRLRADRLALLIDFSNLNLAKSVDYLLSYESNGVDQGVAGSIKPEGSSTNRELLFGTCSKNVCRYHQNITGMKLVVTINLKSGKKIIKPFRVKP